MFELPENAFINYKLLGNEKYVIWSHNTMYKCTLRPIKYLIQQPTSSLKFEGKCTINADKTLLKSIIKSKNNLTSISFYCKTVTSLATHLNKILDVLCGYWSCCNCVSERVYERLFLLHSFSTATWTPEEQD